MDVDPVALSSRWLHVLGAIVLLGGGLFSRLVLLPVIGGLEAEEQSRWHELIRSKWAKWVGITTLVMLVTGFYNYIAVAIAEHKGDGLYHGLMGVKMLLALAVFLLSAALAGRAKALEGIRAKRKLWLTATVLLGVAIVMIAGYLKMRGPTIATPAVDPVAETATVEMAGSR